MGAMHMIRTGLRRIAALLLTLLGAMMLRAVVDATPVIGSPQIDYPGLNIYWPFWPQFAVLWVTLGLGGGLLAALGPAAWSGKPLPVGDLRHLARLWAIWFAVIAGAGFAMFLAYGTMGPLGVPQPILRFAVVNGAVSATVIAALHELVGRWLRRMAPGRPAWRDAIEILVIAMAAYACIVLVIVVAGRLPLRQSLAIYLPAAAYLTSAVTLLAVLTRPSADRQALA